jgi:hypothetical protein
MFTLSKERWRPRRLARRASRRLLARARHSYQAPRRRGRAPSQPARRQRSTTSLGDRQVKAIALSFRTAGAPAEHGEESPALGAVSAVQQFISSNEQWLRGFVGSECCADDTDCRGWRLRDVHVVIPTARWNAGVLAGWPGVRPAASSPEPDILIKHHGGEDVRRASRRDASVPPRVSEIAELRPLRCHSEPPERSGGRRGIPRARSGIHTL